jgi:hypothetical protein
VGIVWKLGIRESSAEESRVCSEEGGSEGEGERKTWKWERARESVKNNYK